MYNRLNVIRGILADIVNASKINKIATTDKTVYSVMELRIKQAKTAAAEFENAKRDDLKEKEEAQINIIQEYLNEKETFTDEEISNAAIKVMKMIEEDGRKVTMGKVINGLVKIGGPFDGKPVEMATVTRIVRNLTSSMQ